MGERVPARDVAHTALTPVRTTTPSFVKRAVMTADAAGSSAGSRRSAASTTVTALPSRAKAQASSQPVPPAPRTTRLRGRSRSMKTVSLVSGSTSASPGTSGTRGVLPVAMTTRSAGRTPPSPRSRRGRGTWRARARPRSPPHGGWPRPRSRRRGPPWRVPGASPSRSPHPRRRSDQRLGRHTSGERAVPSGRPLGHQHEVCPRERAVRAADSPAAPPPITTSVRSLLISATSRFWWWGVSYVVRGIGSSPVRLPGSAIAIRRA